MDITYIDGTGHGITFYDSDDNDDGSRFSMSDERENLIYNGDFSKQNISDNPAKQFKAWTGQNMDRIGRFEKRGKDLRLQSKFTLGGSSELPGDLVGFRQTSVESGYAVREYEFTPGKEFTLSFEASRFGNNKAPITDPGRNLVRNSRFMEGDKYWGMRGLSSELVLDSDYPENSLNVQWAVLKEFTHEAYYQYLDKNIIEPGAAYTVTMLIKSDVFDIDPEDTDAEYSVLVEFFTADENGDLVELLGSGEARGDIINGQSIPFSRHVVQLNIPDITEFVYSEYSSYGIRFTRTDEYGSTDTEQNYIYISSLNLFSCMADDAPIGWVPYESVSVPKESTSNLLANGAFLIGKDVEWNYYDLDGWSAGEPFESYRYGGDMDAFFLSGEPFLRQIMYFKPNGDPANYKLLIWYDSNITMNYQGGFTGCYDGQSFENVGSLDYTQSLQPTDGEIICEELLFRNYGSVEDLEHINYLEFAILLTQQQSSDPMVDPYFNLYKIEYVKETVVEDGEIVWQPSEIDDHLDNPFGYIYDFNNSNDDLRIIFRGIQNGIELPYEMKAVQVTSAKTKYITNYTFSEDITGFELYFGTVWNSSINALISNVMLESGLEASTFHVSNYERQVVSKANTWRDWHIVPLSRPVFNPPAPKTIFVDIPGSNNKLDLTQSLTTYVKYDSREGDFEFLVDSQYRWMDIYETIMKFLHGQELDAILDDDPEYYYHGRFSVDKWKSDQKRSTITIKYVVDAYKYEKYSSTDNWLWDPFSFETGVVHDYGEIDISNYAGMYIIVSDMPVIPEFIVSGLESGNSFLVEWQNKQYSLRNGAQHVAQIEFGPNSDNLLKFYGTATVSIKFKGGKL